MIQALLKKFSRKKKDSGLSAEAYVKAIKKANMEPLANVTAVSSVTQLGAKYDCNMWLKREDQQPVYSFKLRGEIGRAHV